MAVVINDPFVSGPADEVLDALLADAPPFVEDVESEAFASEFVPFEGAVDPKETVAYTMLSPVDREAVDAAVFRIRQMNIRLTLAQVAGDRAAVLIIEGQLAALRKEV